MVYPVLDDKAVKVIQGLVVMCLISHVSLLRLSLLSLKSLYPSARDCLVSV